MSEQDALIDTPLADEKVDLTAEELKAVWPNAPAVDGHIYAFVDPNSKKGMVAMTHTTWENMNKRMDAMQLLAAKIRAENIQLIQERETSGRTAPKLWTPN